jgi:hypothetical protein
MKPLIEYRPLKGSGILREIEHAPLEELRANWAADELARRKALKAAQMRRYRARKRITVPSKPPEQAR